MKYFTPELYLRLQERDSAAMDAADSAWNDAVERYDRSLQTILHELPASLAN